LLESIEGGHLGFYDHAGMGADDLRAWVQGIAIYAASDSLADAHREIADAVNGRKIHPPLGEPVTHGTRLADCPVCGAAIIAEAVRCDQCDTRLHEECYFGRVAPLSEWQEYSRNVNGGPEDYASAVVCAQCRAKDEVG
jgi:hypothetical protein